MSGSLVDYGLYLFHNARRLLQLNKGPYFYLPKMENHLEARLWNDVFKFSQDYLSIEQGVILLILLIFVESILLLTYSNLFFKQVPSRPPV